MRRERDDRAALWDIINAAEFILRITRGLDLLRYSQREETRAAVERKLEVIGEAARRLSPGFRERHADLPWRGIISQRNVLAHEYEYVDDRLIWRVVSDHLPALATKLRAIVASEFSGDSPLFPQ